METTRTYFPKRSWTGDLESHIRQTLECNILSDPFGLCLADVAPDDPNWKTVDYYFCKWRSDGTWEKLNTELTKWDRVRCG